MSRCQYVTTAPTTSPPGRGTEGVGLKLAPITLRAANAFVAQHHRHHKPARGCVFAMSALLDGEVRAVAIVGRPVARHCQDGYTCELTRLCSDGVRNGCSFLYGRAWRAAQAIGYRRMITYTLASEDGASLRGAGWKLIGEAGGGSWSRPSRPRDDAHPLQLKLRWERKIDHEPAGEGEE